MRKWRSNSGQIAGWGFMGSLRSFLRAHWDREPRRSGVSAERRWRWFRGVAALPPSRRAPWRADWAAVASAEAGCRDAATRAGFVERPATRVVGISGANGEGGTLAARREVIIGQNWLKLVRIVEMERGRRGGARLEGSSEPRTSGRCVLNPADCVAIMRKGFRIIGGGKANAPLAVLAVLVLFYWFCPSCHQKNAQATARFILDQVAAAAPHRRYVPGNPEMLCPHFQGHRGPRERLCTLVSTRASRNTSTRPWTAPKACRALS